jgi:predicted P-loop ATPase/GTPase
MLPISPKFNDQYYKMLIHLNDKEFQYYSLNWSNQFIRYLTDSWKNVKINDILCLSDSHANIIKCKVVSMEKSTSLCNLVKKSNYINLYPISQNYETTYYYIQNKLKKQHIPDNLKYEIKLCLFTIKII